MANSRTVLEFESDTGIWTVIAAWAMETGYRQVDSGDSFRRYQKGHGLFMAPQMLEVHRADNKVRLETWVNTNILNRITSLFLTLPRIVFVFLVPWDVHIGSGGIRMKMPRKDVDTLLDKLDQPPIG